MLTGYRRYIAFVIGMLAGLYPLLTGEALDEATVTEIVTAVGTIAAAALALWSKLSPSDGPA